MVLIWNFPRDVYGHERYEQYDNNTNNNSFISQKSKGLAKQPQESHNSRIKFSTAFLIRWLFPYDVILTHSDTFFAWLANVIIFLPISELAS